MSAIINWFKKHFPESIKDCYGGMKRFFGGRGQARSREGFGPGRQEWGYFDVREGAHMFYWLYYTSANVEKPNSRPLLLWLQGGPGASSSGYENFVEIGPLDVNKKNRESTWVKDLNVLFIDNPVGAGFSYVDNPKYYVTNNNEISKDLLTFMKIFLKEYKEFSSTAFYIFTESYGGRMVPQFAFDLNEAIKNNEIKCNFKGIGLGNPFISPVDTIMSYPELLHDTGNFTQEDYLATIGFATSFKNYIMKKNYKKASTSLLTLEQYILIYRNVSFYNVIEPMRSITEELANKIDNMPFYTPLWKENRPLNFDDEFENLSILMNGEVKKVLGLPEKVIWHDSNRQVYDKLLLDSYIPTVPYVEKLLNTTNLKVAIYSGGLDLICCTAGSVKFIGNMNWKNIEQYKKSPRKPIIVNNIIEGYHKTYGNFHMFWLNRCGHISPAENPTSTNFVLKTMIPFDIKN